MKVAVIGAGISGLVAAHRLRVGLGESADITVFERTEWVGGSLRTIGFAGGPVEVGAEAFVGRRPEVPALLAELGLSDQLVRPSAARPLILAESRLHPMPARTLMGIPAMPDSLRGLVDPDTLAGIVDEPQRPLSWEPGADVSVAELVADRFGNRTVERSVDPLLGGVYAGLSSSIGLRAVLPALARELDAGAGSLRRAVSAALPAPSGVPVFGGVRDGYGVLLDALWPARAVRSTTMVTGLYRTGSRWTLAPIDEAFDAVVVAGSAPAAASILAHSIPALSAELAAIPTASSVVVAMALPDTTALPDNSGILVATGEPLRTKAFTFGSRKWPHLAARRGLLVRASLGRFGDAGPVYLDDALLVETAAADLSRTLGVAIDPYETVVQRWIDALPQYGPGHDRRVARIETALAEHPGLALAGNYLHGVGVPACIASATAAAARVGAVAR